MIMRKFGEKGVEHIKGILGHEIRRNWLNETN